MTPAKSTVQHVIRKPGRKSHVYVCKKTDLNNLPGPLILLNKQGSAVCVRACGVSLGGEATSVNWGT
jgi:hypothetical protein